MDTTKHLNGRAEELQRFLGGQHRRLLSRFLRDQYEAVVKPGESAGIFLSGGIDSGSILISLIEDCQKSVDFAYTAVISNPDGSIIESSDLLKARALCAHYGITHREILVPYDPDFVVQYMLDLAEEPVRNCYLNTRADFEVMVMYGLCLEAAAEDGVVALFSGLDDGNIHMVSRKEAVPNKKAETSFGPYTMGVIWLDGLSGISPQEYVMNRRGSDLGIQFCMSHAAVSAQYPYWNLPWKVLNRPREKWVSIRAFADELEEATGKAAAYTNPMQCGDSGAREFFDKVARTSPLAARIVGRSVSSSKVLTNALAKIAESHMIVEEVEDQDFIFYPETSMGEEGQQAILDELHDPELRQWHLDTYGNARAKTNALQWLTSGGEKPLGTVDVDEDGRSDLSYVPEDLGVAPFFKKKSDPAYRENYFADDEGFIDTRVDCFGQPLHRGPGMCNITCERALAGLCGMPTRPGDKEAPVLERCSTYDMWTSAASRRLWLAPSGDEASKVMHKWAASSQQIALAFGSGLSEFLGSQEKLFLFTA